MKLADAPAGLAAALEQARYRPQGRPPHHPANGDLWFDDTDESFRCAVCGTTADPIVTDHCHVTGLVRGRLCVRCNLAEGNGVGNVWPYWRALAPALTSRQIYQPGERLHLTSDEVLSTASMADLFRLDVRRQIEVYNAAVCAAIYDTVSGQIVHPLFDHLDDAASVVL